MQPSIITYHLDSVVEVLSTTDTIRTRSLRWSQHQDQSITGPVQIEEVFTLNGSGAILDCPSDWVAAGHDQIWRVWDPIFIDLWVKDAIVISPDTVLGDTIVTSHLFTAGYQVDTASCSFHQPTDTSFSLEMKTGLGLVELCHFGNYPYQNCFTLVGYRISGVVNGPIALSMREHNSSHETPKLFPNPVNDLLFIRGDHSGQPRMCEVIDASGKVVLATQYAGDGISVSDLPKGIYVLRIHDISGQQHARFVKY